jgi:hypothetical protein
VAHGQYHYSIRVAPLDRHPGNLPLPDLLNNFHVYWTRNWSNKTELEDQEEHGILPGGVAGAWQEEK